METEIGPLCHARASASMIESIVAASRSRRAPSWSPAAAARDRAPASTFRRRSSIATRCQGSPRVERGTVRAGAVGRSPSTRRTRRCALANDTPFGLASGRLHHEPGARAPHDQGESAPAIVWVNTYRAVSPIAPFGGYGLSGHGREGGLAAALDYTRTKTVWLRTSDDADPRSFRDAVRHARTEQTREHRVATANAQRQS